MRTFSIGLAVFTAVVLLFLGYSALTTNVGVSVTGITSEPASNQYEAFAMAATWALKGDNESVTKLSDATLGDVSNYSMVYLSVDVSNWNFLPAEWVQVRVKSAAGDVLQIRQAPGSARGLGGTTFQAVLISENAAANQPRQVEVEYYIFGHKHTVTSQAIAA